MSAHQGRSNIAPPVCQDGVRNWDSREEAEGGGWGPRDSRAEIRFMTEASGAEGLAWWRPVSNSPDKPLEKKGRTMKHLFTD